MAGVNPCCTRNTALCFSATKMEIRVLSCALRKNKIFVSFTWVIFILAKFHCFKQATEDDATFKAFKMSTVVLHTPHTHTHLGQCCAVYFDTNFLIVCGYQVKESNATKRPVGPDP